MGIRVWTFSVLILASAAGPVRAQNPLLNDPAGQVISGNRVVIGMPFTDARSLLKPTYEELGALGTGARKTWNFKLLSNRLPGRGLVSIEEEGGIVVGIGSDQTPDDPSGPSLIGRLTTLLGYLSEVGGAAAAGMPCVVRPSNVEDRKPQMLRAEIGCGRHMVRVIEVEFQPPDSALAELQLWTR